MIRKILTTYAARLDEYLARSHRQPEGVAEVSGLSYAGGCADSTIPYPRGPMPD